METQKIVNLLNGSDIESSKFATRKWCIINDQNNGQYGEVGENDSTIKFEAKVIKPNLCDYSDAYILVTVEYSDSYADSSGSLWHFKKDKQNMTNAGNLDNVTTADSTSFKYKSSLIENKNGATIALPLEYLSNFF